MKRRMIFSMIGIFLLSFFSLSFAVEKAQMKPGVVQTRPIQVTPVELPDLVVDSIWLDNQCNINFRLKNAGKGNIPDAEHRESVVRVQIGENVKDFLLGRVDSNGVLKKGGGVVSFNTDVLLKSPVEVKVIVDFNKKIKETETGERKNEITARLTPQCPSAVKDQHYKLDTDKGQLQFGDGSKGKILPEGDKRIKVSSYRTGESAKSQKSDAPLQKSPTLTIPPPGKTGMKADTLDGIKVKSPNQNTYINKGFNLSIEWESFGLAANYTTFRIELYDPALGKMARKISSENGISFPNKQTTYSYSWEVPEELFLQKGIVRVGTMDGKYSTDSAIFNILPSKAKLTPGSSIKVNSPTAGQIFLMGDTCQIKWKSPLGSSGYRKIELLDMYENSVRTIADNIMDGGDGAELSNPWKIPSDISNDNYQIKISSPDNKYFGYSGKIIITDKASPSITVINPSKGDVWGIGKTHTVKWKPTGIMDPKVKIMVYYPGSNFEPSQHGKTWLGGWTGDTYIGSVTWPISIASQTIRGPVKLRVQTSDSKVFGDSEIFKLGDATITVTSPVKGETWIPLKPYTIKWTFLGVASWYETNNVNVTLFSADQPSSSTKIPLLKNFSTPRGSGEDTYSADYTGVLGNISSGNYFVRVESSLNPILYADSQPIVVKSALSSDTAFLTPDSAQNEVDLALQGVFFDGIEIGNLAAKIKNMGNDYTGNIRINYNFMYMGSQTKSKWDITGEATVLVDIKHNQVKTIPFLSWSKFSASYGVQYGQYGIPQSGPIYGNVTISPEIGTDINPSNNTISSVTICKTPKADIGTDGYLHLYFNKNDIYIHKGTTNKIHESYLKWISNDTFEANLEVGLWNYGCVQRTFDCWFYVDKLPGQLIKKVTLYPGQRMKFNETVKIKVPKRGGPHLIAFIADPDEAKNEVYPNSYQNNFINGYLEILTGGTVTGSGL